MTGKEPQSPSARSSEMERRCSAPPKSIPTEALLTGGLDALVTKYDQRFTAQ
jgi:hypothetical protein